MGFLSDIITGPYAGIIVLAAGMLIAIFAGFSSNRKANIFMAGVTALSFAAGIYLYIRNYLTEGTVSGSLVSIGLSGTILSVIIIFAGLNILFLKSLGGLSQKGFVRQLLLLAFSVISLLLLIMANNLIMFSATLIITILSIFNLLASSVKDNAPAREYVGKYGLRSAVPAALILFGFSLLAGTGRLGNITSYANFEGSRDALFMISVFVLGAAVYLYFFLYPFQGTLIKLSRRAGSGSAAILWFLYIPTGIIILMKLEAFFSNYYGREGIYGFVVLTVLAFLNLFGPGLGAIKAGNLKRILTMFIIFQLGTILLVRAAGFTGRASSYPAGIFDLLILTVILIAFLPLSVFSLILEKNGSGGNIIEARGFFRTYPYAGACFLIISLWWIAANIYLFFLKGPLPGALLFQQGVEAGVLYIGFAAALIFMAVNITRIIAVFFGRPSGEKLAKPIAFPIIFYIYISIFTLIAAALTVLVIIGKAGIGQGGIEFWDSTFNIFGNGN
jgi:NADH:ubiquinone oxidoreductase subunit 2 (subunit N)